MQSVAVAAVPAEVPPLAQGGEAAAPPLSRAARRRLEKLRRKEERRLRGRGEGAPGPAQAPAAEKPAAGSARKSPPAAPLACRDETLAEAAKALACWESSRGWMFQDPAGALCRAVAFAGVQAVALCANDPAESFAGSRIHLRFVERELCAPKSPARARAQDAARARQLLRTLDQAFDPKAEGAYQRFFDLAALALRACYPSGDAAAPFREAQCFALARALWTVLERKTPVLVLHASRTLLWTTSGLARPRKQKSVRALYAQEMSLLDQAGALGDAVGPAGDPALLNSLQDEFLEAYKAGFAAVASDTPPAPP